MTNTSDKPGIKITLEDLDKIAVVNAGSSAPAAIGRERNYGNISTAEQPLAADTAETRAGIMLQAWFYLAVAGFSGAFLAWAICEPAFVDGEGAGSRWGNTWLIPLVIAMLCIGFGLAESIVERSVKKAAYRTVLAVPLGIVFGFVFNVIANIVYTVGIQTAVSLGAHDFNSPALWIARAVAWAVFGIAAGLVYGIIGQSAKKAQYGILGGMLGAGVGGVLFDPIAFALNGAALSRMFGFSLFGISTGAAMGVVESALKHKWLYVNAGPLAGKQFILYKQKTTIGSNQQCDIYLFKDPAILPDHAIIETRGSRLQIRANGPVYVSGQPIHTRVLQDDDLVQIGRYAIRYKEKQKS